MTAQVIPVMDQLASAGNSRKLAPPSFIGLWISTLFIYIVPHLIGRLWLRATPWRVVTVAVLNALLSSVWAFWTLMCVDVWSSGTLRLNRSWSDIHMALIEAAPRLLASFSRDWATFSRTDKSAAICMGVFVLAAAFLIPFFILLPFGARPGSNRACVRHVARTVLLGTGALPIWWLAFSGVFLVLIAYPARLFSDEYFRAVSPLLATFSVLAIWTLSILIYAVRLDYRTTKDFPAPHDPWCEDCGYDLIAAELTGRCPECGRPVSESLGAHTRPPTPWETRPSPFNFSAVIPQIKLLVRRPRQLFFSMPTLTGQRAAQRWLLLSMLAVGCLAAMIVPCISAMHEFAWSLDLFVGSLAMGLVWAAMGAMMVGIETAGVAVFSRVRNSAAGQAWSGAAGTGIAGGGGVFLSTAAKVTAYASILMLPWVLLGGLQLLGVIFWADHLLYRVWHVSLRNEQLLLATSLSIAHIGGLLWFELTVYRGVRAIQFANK